jgi:transglutaminase-like putative cysteine protease
VQLTNWFQTSLYVLAALTGFMLAVAEGQPAPQMLSPFLALIAWVYTDRRGMLVLSTLWANAWGFLAICLALAEFFGGGIESRLLSGAHLLVYATWIVLFQRKTIRLAWWLCALCLLQVAVGAVLTRHEFYGFLVVVFFFLAVWTLSLFSLYQAQQRLAAAAAEAGLVSRVLASDDLAASGGVPCGTGDAVFDAGRLLRGRRGLGLAGGLAPAAAWLRSPSQVKGTIQYDPQERWLRLRFVAGTLLSAAVSLVVGLVFFLLTPRLWIGSGQQFRDEPRPGISLAVSGFSDNVQLGQFGKILTSPEPVFRVRLADARSGVALDVERYALGLGLDEPLFRGAVLSQYDSRSGIWVSVESGTPVRVPRRILGGFVRQEFTLAPIDTDVLFAMHPVRACRIETHRGPAAGYQDPWSARLFAAHSHGSESRYDVYSPRESDAADGDLVDGRHSPPGGHDLRLPAGLPGLAQLARQVAGYVDASNHPPEAEMARRLLGYLRDSEQFVYSLEMSAVDPASDPIEDFLLRRRAGHCEYFASALTLLLRAVGIPARLVNGFKGGVPFDDGSYEVQRRHAHAWCEAFYDGRWHVLDPTPAAARLASVAEMGSTVRSFQDLMSLLSQTWSNYVVNMDFARQRQQFYEPLRVGWKRLWESLQGDREQAASLLGSIRGFLSSPRRWFSWQGGVVTFVLLLLLCGLVWLLRRVWRVLRYLWTRVRNAAVHRERRVEFYERFRRLCERRGLVRATGQTQREFAEDVSRQLQPLLAACGLIEFPGRVAELFYGVRFGEQPLDPAYESEVERRLDTMERALSNDRHHANRNGGKR